MIPLLNFISSVSYWLYGVCALVLLFAIRSWWFAQRERQRTIYGLEKETANEHALRALTFAFVALAMAAVVYVADANAMPVPVTPQRSPTPNLALFITPTATVPPPTPTPAPPTPTPLRGQPPPATPSPKISSPTNPTNPPPTARPNSLPPACPDPSARITAPGVDAHLAGFVSVSGSANIANFQYYKVEYGVGEQPQGWTVIGALHRQPINEGVLATFSADTFPPGVYRLRLTVVDQRGNFPIAPCIVRVVFGQ